MSRYAELLEPWYRRDVPEESATATQTVTDRLEASPTRCISFGSTSSGPSHRRRRFPSVVSSRSPKRLSVAAPRTVAERGRH